MKQSFHELKPEKQRKIISAGLEVFAKNDYKHAATDDIAAKAGISKGLLFYYFQNKKSLYEFLLNYVMKFTEKLVLGDEFNSITDFFDLLEYAAVKKMKICEKMPFLLDFMVKAYFSHSLPLSDKLVNLMKPSSDNKKLLNYFKNVDTSKFKSPDDLYKIMEMLLWISEGYLLECQRKGKSPDMKDFIEKFREWSALFKNTFYKEEYL